MSSILAVLSLLAPAGGVLAQGAGAETTAGREAWRQVDGTVGKVNREAGQVVADGQTYLISESLSPKVGDRIAFTYREQGGRKVITSFGHPQR